MEVIAFLAAAVRGDYKRARPFLIKKEFLNSQDDTPCLSATVTGDCKWFATCMAVAVFRSRWNMTLRIERVQGGIRLSGEFRAGHLDQVKTEIDRCESPVVLDLEELDLIDLEGVRFLNACEAKGISILHCSPYIREWMLQERGRKKAQPDPLT
jgi:hypothetical protein